MQMGAHGPPPPTHVAIHLESPMYHIWATAYSCFSLLPFSRGWNFYLLFAKLRSCQGRPHCVQAKLICHMRRHLELVFYPFYWWFCSDETCPVAPSPRSPSSWLRQETLRPPWDLGQEAGCSGTARSTSELFHLKKKKKKAFLGQQDLSRQS